MIEYLEIGKKCIKNMLFFFYFKGFYGIIIYVYRSTFL